MELKIKYDLTEIGDELKKQVAEQVAEQYAALLRETFSKLDSKLATFANDITTALEIKDERQRERIRKAYAYSLDKWAKGIIKNA